jgi:hypothetical protein
MNQDARQRKRCAALANPCSTLATKPGPRVGQHLVEQSDSSLVDFSRLYGGCIVVLKMSSAPPGRRRRTHVAEQQEEHQPGVEA